LRGIAVISQLSDNQAAPLAYFSSIVGESGLAGAVLPAPVFTDAEGRFRITGLVSGLNYSLRIREEGKDIGEIRKEISIKPGATVDLDKNKMKASSGKDTGDKRP
jgi:hypothetical protein